MTRAELNALALCAQRYIDSVGTYDGPDARDWFFKECSPERILWMRQRIERLEAALEEIAGHGCYRVEATAGQQPDVYDHLATCVNLACAALAESAPARDERGET